MIELARWEIPGIIDNGLYSDKLCCWFYISKGGKFNAFYNHSKKTITLELDDCKAI